MHSAIMMPRLLLVASSVALAVIGLVMIYSASSASALKEYGDSARYFKTQLGYLVVGVVIVYALARIDYHFWEGNVSWALWGVEIALLVATRLFGVSGTSGAQRWISLGPLGTLQPSEFAKIVVMLLFSSYLVRWQDGQIGFRRFLLLSGVAVLVPLCLVLLQPDLGTTVIILMTVLFVLYFGEVDTRAIVLLVVGIAVIGTLAVVVAPYRLKRVMTFLHPFDDPQGDGYQIVNSLYAFASGGVGGVGLGMSHQKYSYLPEAHTDFIFAIIGEELGLIGCLVVIFLFIVFVYAGIQIARHAPTHYGRVIAGSSAGAIGLQAFLNMACTVSLFPVTGKPLPFISAGGSSLLATLILVGLMLSVSYQSSSDVQADRRRRNMVVYDGGRPSRPDVDVPVRGRGGVRAGLGGWSRLEPASDRDRRGVRATSVATRPGRQRRYLR